MKRSHRNATYGVLGGAALVTLYACRSFASPTKPVEKLPGVDLTALQGDDQALQGFYDVAAEEPSPCRPGQSLLDAMRKQTCLHAEYAGRYLVRLEKADLVPSEVQSYYEERFLAKPVTLDLTHAPMEGPANAPVTIVEFADFECPHCKHLQPEMRQVLALYPKEVKLYFKNFPLGQHEHSIPAAVAAEAAGRQGKFWQMEATLFEHQDNLEPSDIDGYARDIGLDLDKFHADIADPAVKQLVLKDRSEADDLKLEGTPTVFIDGIQMHGPKTADDISDWVDDALNRPPPPEN